QHREPAVIAAGQHHAFRYTELHLARREIGNDDDELADERFGRVVRLDAGEDVALAERAQIDRQPQQLVGAVDAFRLIDARDAQVDLGEVVDGDFSLSPSRPVFTG